MRSYNPLFMGHKKTKIKIKIISKYYDLYNIWWELVENMDDGTKKKGEGVNNLCDILNV